MSTPAPRRLSAETRREQILEVAETLFIERGFEGVAMADVAQALGTSRPTVYSYFTCTDEMWRALLDARSALLWGRLGSLLPTASPLPGSLPSSPSSPSPPPPSPPPHSPPPGAAEQAQLYSGVFRALLGERELLLLLHSGGGPPFRLQRDRFLTRLAERITPAQPGQDGGLSGALEAVTLLLEAAAVQALRHPGRDAQVQARMLGQFIAGGLDALKSES